MDLPFTVDQVAAITGCTNQTVQALARAGQLPGLKLGVDWVFPAGALFQRLDEMALEQAAERRKVVPTPSPAPQPAVRAVLQAVPAAKQRRRPLPVLPTLPGSTQPGG